MTRQDTDTTEIVDAATIDAWLNGDMERPCQTLSADSDDECGRSAKWIAHARCSDGHAKARFICDDCRGILLVGDLYCGDDCDRILKATWIERTYG